MAIPVRKYKVKLTFVTPVLGSTPGPKVYTQYVAAEAQEAGKYINDELQTLVDQPRGKTGFHREGSTPVLYDYVIKGFCKEACTSLRRADDSSVLSKKFSGHKTKIDTMMHIYPRHIPLQLRRPTYDTERPLRTETPQGQRVALVSSTTAPEETVMEFQIHVIGNVIPEDVLREWFDYGFYHGIGQWRGSGWGQFTAEIEAV